MAKKESQKKPPARTTRTGGGGGEPNGGGRPAWSAEEKLFLEENLETMGDREIADRLGMTKSGVVHMRNRLGLGPSKRVPIEGFSWTKEMDATVRRNPDMRPEELARLMGRTAVAVVHRRQHLGLARSRSESSCSDDVKFMELKIAS